MRAVVIGALGSEIGGWRSRLVFRIAGFGALNWVFGRTYHETWSESYAVLASHPPAELLGIAAYVAVLFGGPRVGWLLVAAAANAWLVFVDGPRVAGISHPVERLLMIALPLYAVLAHALHARRGRPEDAEVSIVAFLRCATLLVTAFLALHKMNRDFLDPVYSCHAFVVHRLSQWAYVGDLAARMNAPILAVASEAMMAPLLLLRPRLGMLFVTILISVLFVAAFGQIAVIVIGLSYCFLEDTDRTRLLARRGVWMRGSATLFAAFATAVLFVPYTGELMTIELLLYSAFVSVSIAGLCVLGFEDVHAAWDRGVLARAFAFLGPGPRFAWPSDAASRAMVAVATLLLFVNCMAPYLGFKFEYSFAMYSNLRVDDDRWNSFVFPPALRVFDRGDWIRVERSELVRGGEPVAGSAAGALEGLMFQPVGLGRRLAELGSEARPGTRHELELVYRGERHSFRNAFGSRRFLGFLQSLPPATMFWRLELSGRAPQPCVH